MLAGAHKIPGGAGGASGWLALRGNAERCKSGSALTSMRFASSPMACPLTLTRSAQSLRGPHRARCGPIKLDVDRIDFDMIAVKLCPKWDNLNVVRVLGGAGGPQIVQEGAPHRCAIG